MSWAESTRKNAATIFAVNVLLFQGPDVGRLPLQLLRRRLQLLLLGRKPLKVGEQPLLRGMQLLRAARSCDGQKESHAYARGTSA